MEASLSTITFGIAEPTVIAIGFKPRRLVAFPLRARGRTHGVLLLAFGAGRQFASTDFSFANDVAGRASVLLDNASLYKEVRDADRRKNEFLAMLGHELRNPMAPIRYAVQILRKANLEDQKRLWSLDVIDRQVKQLARLVDDLLDVSRITRGKIELKVGPVDLGQVVATAVETSRPLIDSLRHRLSVNLPDETLRVQGDFSRLTQVLANLLNNAAKYTEPGGRIALELAQEWKRCRLSCARLRNRHSSGKYRQDIRTVRAGGSQSRSRSRGPGGRPHTRPAIGSFAWGQHRSP